MAEKTTYKSKGRKAKKSKYIEKSSITINNYHNEQHGQTNTFIAPIVQTDNTTLMPNLSLEEPTKRNEKLVEVVNSIICPQNLTKPSPMDVHEFNLKFKEIYKDDFKSISGVHITQFVDKNHHVFETSTDDRQRMMIHIKNRKLPRKKKNNKEKQKSIAQSRKADDVYETDYITAESDELVEETSDEDSLDERSEEAFLESIKDRQNLTFSVSESDDNDASLGESPRTKWKEVRRHKNRTSFSGTATQDQDQEKTQQEIHVQYCNGMSGGYSKQQQDILNLTKFINKKIRERKKR